MNEHSDPLYQNRLYHRLVGLYFISFVNALLLHILLIILNAREVREKSPMNLYLVAASAFSSTSKTDEFLYLLNNVSLKGDGYCCYFGLFNQRIEVIERLERPVAYYSPIHILYELPILVMTYSFNALSTIKIIVLILLNIITK